MLFRSGQPLDCVPVAPGIGHYAAVKAGQPMTKVTWNPELMAEEEFSFFYLEQLIRHLKRLGSLVLLHICNDTTRLLNRMVEIGADILSLDVQVDLAEAKKIVAGRAGISGNVATWNLTSLSPQKIYEEACRCIDKAAAGRRYTLGSSCEGPYETPEENIDAMVRAAREYGAQYLDHQR